MNVANIRQLNEACSCVSVDRARLIAELDALAGESGFGEKLSRSHPFLFSGTSAFLASEELAQMMETVAAIEAVARDRTYRDAVFAFAPRIACREFGPRGAFMGYDFHITAQGPRLIEINTNAGGAILNLALLEGQRSCCTGLASPVEPLETGAQIVSMFRREWELQRGASPLRRIAIVDASPGEQYLFPEFVLTGRFFRRHGIDARIAAPDRLRFDGQTLTVDGLPVDLVYNRLTDFYLEAPENRALHDAYVSGAVVVTPNPHHHAVLAHKHNLTLLSDPKFAAGLSVGELHAPALARIPRTVEVTGANADALWAGRKNWFFKPHSGFGGKGVYRGEKITRQVWAHILAGGYLAQELALPGRRNFLTADGRRDLKMDVRLYVYDGRLILPAARLYEGQTTNFRTPGGGFAPVLAG